MSKMLASHRKVLEALTADGEEYFYNFASLTFHTQMDRKEVRRITRHLARKGWTEFGRGLWNEDGEPCGSGYRITKAGLSALTSSMETLK